MMSGMLMRATSVTRSKPTQIFGSVVYCSAKSLETREISIFLERRIVCRSKPVLLDLKCKLFILTRSKKNLEEIQDQIAICAKREIKVKKRNKSLK